MIARNVTSVQLVIIEDFIIIDWKIHNFATDHGETNVLKRESGERPELCPQRYVL